MKTNWDRYYERKMRDPTMRAMVDEELYALRVGAQLARLRQKAGLTQAKLAALCDMKAPHVSRIENDPAGNLTLRTFVRLAYALGRSLKLELEPFRAPASVKRYAVARKATTKRSRAPASVKRYAVARKATTKRSRAPASVKRYAVARKATTKPSRSRTRTGTASR